MSLSKNHYVFMFLYAAEKGHLAKNLTTVSTIISMLYNMHESPYLKAQKIFQTNCDGPQY